MDVAAHVSQRTTRAPSHRPDARAGRKLRSSRAEAAPRSGPRGGSAPRRADLRDAVIIPTCLRGVPFS